MERTSANPLAYTSALLLCETCMIELFDDSLFPKFVSAPYVSNTELLLYTDGQPWGV